MRPTRRSEPFEGSINARNARDAENAKKTMKYSFAHFAFPFLPASET
jgi:hypothetical protein